MTPVDWAIRHPFLPLVLISLLSVLGLRAAFLTPLTHLPELGENRIVVRLQTDSGSLDLIDKQVAQPVEQSLQALSQITSISSEVSAAEVFLLLSLRNSREAQKTVGIVSDRINALIPHNDVAFRITEIRAISSREQAAVEFAIVPQDGDLLGSSTTMRDTIRPALREIEGISEVAVRGEQRLGLAIHPNPRQLEDADITVDELSSQLSKGLGRDVAHALGGDVSSAPVLFSLSQPGREDRPVYELEQLALLGGTGASVPLGAVAKVSLSAFDDDWTVRHNGEPALLVQIHVDAGADLGRVLTALDETLERFAATLPQQRIVVINRPAERAIAALSATQRSLVEGAFLVIAVIGLTLRGARSTVLAALALPLSLLPTLFVMHSLGLSLNIVSLLALTLASGILVDDAIVEIENINKHMATGMPPRVAVGRAVREIALPVIGTSCAILAVFLPIAAMPGEAGRYFWAFGSTLCIATIMSLAVSRLVIPPLAARFPDKPRLLPGNRSHGHIARSRDALVLRALRHRWLGLSGAILISAAAVFAATKHHGAFIPLDRTDHLLVEVALPSGMMPDDRKRHLRTLESDILLLPRVASVTALHPAARDRHPKLLVVTDGSQDAEDEILGLLAGQPDLKVAFLNGNEMPKLVFDVAAPDRFALHTAVSDVMKALSASDHEGAAPIVSGGAYPEIRLIPDAGILRQVGLVHTDIQQFMSVLAKDSGRAITHLPRPQQDSLPVHLVLDMVDHGPSHAVPHLAFAALRLPQGDTLPLASLGRFEIHMSELAVMRRDGLYVQRIIADPLTDAAGRDMARITRQTVAALQKDIPGLVLLPAGDTALRQAMMQELSSAVGVGLLLLSATLFVLFASVGQTLVILASLLFSLGGAMMVLVATNLPLSLPAIIGILLLFGIVAKNGILLIDRALRLRGPRVTMAKALVLATRDRTRPIVMTSVAMIAGMLPAAFAGHDGSAFRQPLALTVMGGVAVATLLSLVLLPAMALVAHDAGLKIRSMAQGSIVKFNYLRRDRTSGWFSFLRK